MKITFPATIFELNEDEIGTLTKAYELCQKIQAKSESVWGIKIIDHDSNSCYKLLNDLSSSIVALINIHEFE